MSRSEYSSINPNKTGSINFTSMTNYSDITLKLLLVHNHHHRHRYELSQKTSKRENYYSRWLFVDVWRCPDSFLPRCLLLYSWRSFIQKGGKVKGLLQCLTQPHVIWQNGGFVGKCCVFVLRLRNNKNSRHARTLDPASSRCHEATKRTDPQSGCCDHPVSPTSNDPGPLRWWWFSGC